MFFDHLECSASPRAVSLMQDNIRFGPSRARKHTAPAENCRLQNQSGTHRRASANNCARGPVQRSTIAVVHVPSKIPWSLWRLGREVV